MSNRVVVRACLAGNRFLGSLKVYKYGIGFQGSVGCARIYRPSFRENKPKTLVFAKTGPINSGTEFYKTRRKRPKRGKGHVVFVRDQNYEIYSNQLCCN
jgi:hypothetical protein